MAFKHYDSFVDKYNDRSDNVCSRLHEWKKQQELKHGQEFKRIPPCTALLGEQRSFLRSAGRELSNRERKRELWKAIERTTPGSFEEEARSAQLARNVAGDDFEAAQAIMSDLQVKEDTLIMARNSVNQTFDTEDISPATDHFSSSTGDLSSPNGMGRREAITTRAQAIECSSECHPGITKGTFQQLNHEISDEVNGAEVDIEQRQQPLEKAGHIVNGPNCMRHANEALAGMLNQRNNRLSWVVHWVSGLGHSSS
ncbi:hypothetical protein NW756_008872 [Fusarium oxysporum]|nr:hypothetical protein NW756_008872 [Fusarium oxysporum]